VKVEVAASPEAIKKGLSGRPSLPKGTGLLFIFPEWAPQSMWMKGMHFPLDIIWLDEQLAVTAITGGAPPCLLAAAQCPSYPSGYSVKYAIEMNAGDAATYGFRQGVQLAVVS
jgi:uncharacterized membrane protein (UPF0127 family)